MTIDCIFHIREQDFYLHFKLSRQARTPQKPKEKQINNKSPAKPNACNSKGLAARRRSPADQRRQEKSPPKNEQKRQKPKGRKIQKKIPAKPNACVSKGLARTAATSPRTDRHQKKQKNKKSKRPKSFLDKFGALPAAASCPPGKSTTPLRGRKHPFPGQFPCLSSPLLMSQPAS